MKVVIKSKGKLFCSLFKSIIFPVKTIISIILHFFNFGLHFAPSVCCKNINKVH